MKMEPLTIKQISARMIEARPIFTAGRAARPLYVTAILPANTARQMNVSPGIHLRAQYYTPNEGVCFSFDSHFFDYTAQTFFANVVLRPCQGMGRRDTKLSDPGTLIRRGIPIDAEGYDPGGCYWGTGSPLYALFNYKTGHIEYIRET